MAEASLPRRSDDTSEPTATLADVDIVAELDARPRRPADYEKETRALAGLAAELARNPRTMLQKLVETAVELCNADTAGLSLLEGEIFRWEAVAGVFASFRNGTMPRAASPCGVCIDRNATQLMHLADRCFPALRTEPRFVEALLIPFHVQGAPIGTVWIVSHSAARTFDREDERLVRNLAQFASAGWQLWNAYELTAREGRRKDEFLAMLGHELRNPLAAVVNATAVLRSEATTELTHRMIDVVARQTQDLTRMVDGLLDMSRITQGKLELQPEPLELAPVLADVVASARPHIERRRHRLSVQVPPEPIWLNADRVRLAQIVANLLDNAAKYTPDGGDIWLTAERTAEGVSLIVRDTGIGIPPEHLRDAFDLFRQIDRFRTRSTAGLGLGLTLVRSLAELHGGSVEAASSGEGQGSQFTVRLPALSPSPPPVEPRPPLIPDAVPVPRRILLVEDNDDVAQSFSITLALEGHSVRSVSDGRSALEALPSFQPDVVLLDVGLPDMSGYDVARQIRQDHDGADLMIVTLSGFGQQQDQRESYEAGCDEHLVKPVDLDLLRGLFNRPRSATARPGGAP